MNNIPEHIHALPRVNPNVILPDAVPTWDSENKILYIGDGKTEGGIPFKANSDDGKKQLVNQLDGDNQIYIRTDVIPVTIKTHLNTFYSIRGEDLSLSYDETKIIIDITNALAVNDLSEFQDGWVWTVYFAKGEFGEKGEQGIKGEDGYTPVRGKDFWTQEDIENIHEYIDEYIDDKFLNERW